MIIWDEMKENRVVGLKAILQKGSLDNIIQSVFGTNYLGSEKEVSTNRTLMLLVQEGYDLIYRFNLEDYFPLRFLDFYGVKRKCLLYVYVSNCIYITNCTEVCDVIFCMYMYVYVLQTVISCITNCDNLG